MPDGPRPLIAFDLDGTLVDSRRDLADSANELVTGMGGDPLPLDAVTGMVGDGARALVQRVLGAAGVDADEGEALARFLEIYDRRLVRHTRPYDGIAEAVAELASMARLAVLTNKPQHHTDRLLEALSLRQHFSWAVGGDAMLPRKPDPAGLAFLLERAGVAASEALYVGDTMVDVETARRAGVRVCVAAYGFAQFREGLALAAGELVVDDPRQLRDVLVTHLATLVST